MKKFSLKVSQGPQTILNFLGAQTDISKQKIKNALIYGAVQYKKGGVGKFRKIRKSTFEVNTHDEIVFHYDEKVLALPPVSEAKCIYENKDFGVWFKDVGVLSQGNQFSDHTSLLRFVEKERKQAFLIHRLDRETPGLMLIAYTPRASAYYSKLFADGKVIKKYQAIVLDEMNELPGHGKIDFQIEGKNALTEFWKVDSKEGLSLVDINLHTGRLHQIRRHFDQLGFPLLGDPLYGKNNKNTAGLQLVSYYLEFLDLNGKKNRKIQISPLDSLIW